MLEHPHRNDAVENSGDVPVVFEPELDGTAQLSLFGPRARQRQLLGRERNAGHSRTAHLGEIECQAAPAGTDIKYAVVRSNEQLGGQVAFLRQLRVVERLIGALEICAAVLPVGIEEQGIEARIEIIMVRDVLARAPRRIELL